MTKKLLIAAAIFVGIYTACNKSNENVAPDFFIGATKQNSNWVAVPSANFFPTPDTLNIRGYRASGEENLTFKIKFSGIGTYQLTGTQARYYTTLGQDALTSDYKLDNTATNTVTITSYNDVTGIAMGRFQISFVKTNGAATLPNSLSFTNGQFWLPVPR